MINFIKIRVPVTVVVTLALIYVDFFYRNITITPLDSVYGFFGIALVVLGLFIRSWSAGMLMKNNRLSTKGPYALCRNPLYLGSMLLTIGFLVIIGDWVTFIILAVLSLVLYIPVIKKEEEVIRNLFKEDPEFDRFFSTTPRLIPYRFGRIKEAFEGEWQSAVWKKNKEYHAIIASVLILILLHFYAA